MLNTKDLILEEYEKSKALHGEYCVKIENLIRDILKENNIDCHSIESRLKDESSLATKVSNSVGKYSSLSDITDVSALRIITYFSEDVDKIAEIIQNEFFIDQENSVDKRIKLDPDRFGYLSLHYVVGLREERIILPEYKRFKGLKVEIQIRSILQHAWAEIEHDLGYKNKVSIPRVVRRDFSRLAGLLELADEEFVKIRKTLMEYNKNVKEEIKIKPANVLIDKITIQQLLEDGENIATKIDLDICKIGNATRIATTDNDIELDVKRLKYVGLNTIDELLNSLNIYREQIIMIANEWLANNKEDTLLAGISLFYLPYAMLGAKGSYEDIEQYLEEMLIGDFQDHHDTINDIMRLTKK